MRNFKKFLALVLAMMMVVGGMVTVSAAEEAATYDYTAAAEALADLGIVKGTSDDVIDFALEDKVVRYQMALLVARIMTGEVDDTYWNKVVENTTPFDDVTKYYGAIAYVADNEIVEGKGWIPGVGDNCFDPEGAITYEQALTMAVRALGYKQLVYPTGFVNTAKELGLTDGLEELAGDTQLTRGQMFQIIYNLFFTAGKDGKDFATKAFGLETKSYVVVATENQALIGAKRVYRVDYQGTGSKWNKYVALAPINKDGSYDLDAIIHLTEGELGMEFKESEYRLGYSYTVQSFDGFKTAYKVIANATKTFQNYGDVKSEIAAGAKYHGHADQLIKLDGTTYKLVEAYTDLNNKDSYSNRQPELIVHSLFEGDALAEISNLYFDALGNVVDPATGDVLIIYNMINGVYYVEDATGYLRVATDADWVAAATKVSKETAQYGIVTSVSKLLTDVAFCEITLFDDNNDGAWDRGLYIPYSIGKYTTDKTSDNAAKDTFDVKTSTMTRNTYGLINGIPLNATVEKADKTWGTVTKISEADIDFIGAGRPTKDQYVVYYYNAEGRVFNTLEKASVEYGKVTAVNQGTYSYDAKIPGYFWKNATVTIEGEDAALVLGYRPYQTNSQIIAADKTDLTYIDAELANFGYDKIVYDCLLNNSFFQLGYVVLGNRIVYVTPKDTRAVAGTWIAFDYGVETTSTVPYTTYGYKGDIIGVDADGNILVNAYVEGKSEQIVAAIGSINGFDTFGELVADYAALNFGFSGIGILDAKQYETMQQIVIRRFFDTLAKDLGTTYIDDEQNEVEARQLMYTVTSVEDGVYNIYTDINVYWGAEGNPYRQPTPVAGFGKFGNVTYSHGWNNASYGGYAGQKYFQTNDKSVLIVIGIDGIRVARGQYTEGATINWSSAKAACYDLGADLTVAVSPTAKCEQIYTGKFADEASAYGYTYYWVIGDITTGKLQNNTSATVTWDINGVGTYTYKNLYNLNTNKLEAKTVVGGLPEFQADKFGDLVVNTKPLGAIYAEKDGKWTLVNELTTSTIEGNVVTTVKYAPDAYNDLMKIIYNTDATATYASVFSTYGTCISGQTGHGYSWKFKDPAGNEKEIFESGLNGLGVYQLRVTFGANGVLSKIEAPAGSANARAYAAGGVIYYNYVPGTSFVGTYVYGQVGKTAAQLKAEADDKAAADAAALATYKADKKAEVKAYLFAYTTVAKYEAAFAAIDAAADKAAVDTIVAAYKADLDAAKAAADAIANNDVVVDGETAIMLGAGEKLFPAMGSSSSNRMLSASLFVEVDGRWSKLAATTYGLVVNAEETTLELTDGYKIVVSKADGNIAVTPILVEADDAGYEYESNVLETAGKYLVRLTTTAFGGGDAKNIDIIVTIAE